MKYKYLLLFISILSFFHPRISKGQSFLGIINSNYAGATSMNLQPASIADSRYKFDMTLIGVSATLANNYFGVQKEGIFESLRNPQLNFAQTSLITRNLDPGDKVNANINAKVDLFSFMVSFGESSAIGFNLGFRNFLNIDDLSQDLARATFADIQGVTIPAGTTTDNGLSVDNLSWVQYGLTFANTLIDNNTNYLKGGLTLKLVSGVGSGYLYANELDYGLNDSIINVTASNINYGHSDNIDNVRFDSLINQTFSSLSFSGIAPAVDFGFVYEYRPDIEEYRRKRPDGKYEYEDYSNKYKFKFGISVLDVGKLKFDKGNNSGNFGGATSNFNVNQFSLTSIDALDDSIQSRFDALEDDGKYTVELPTALSMQLDYHINKGFYINLSPYLALNRNRNPDQPRVSEITTYSLTPRWESKWVDVGVPFSYNEYNNVNVGLSLRLGPIIVGTNDILPLIGKKEIYGTDFHFAVKIPIAYGKQKDTDQDGVPDVADVCPDVPGLPDLNGCPDSDKDGIADNVDRCPLEFGLAKFTGCPDSDNDEVQDSEDACPNVAGAIAHNGCPDSDLDGLYDNEDDCPLKAGPTENKGCPYPDKDNDGVRDIDDKCPDVAGPISNNGCPVTDKDKDGIPDKDDKCPNTPGIAELNGCPKLEEKEEQILKVAFDNLEFETGKDIIRATSFASLNDLANLLVTKPSYGLRIAGHTDNVGTDESNMILSNKRATAVKNYLISKGVPANKLVVEYYGETKPIADNNTKEGKQKNRRVEMTVIFE